MPENETRLGEIGALGARWFARWGRTLGWVLLLAAILIALDRRCHAFFVNPDLRAEDGRAVYAFFYHHREQRALLRFKGGYLPLIPNALGFISVRLPPKTAPYFLTLLPVVFTLAAYGLFNGSAYRRYAEDARLRWCCCAGLALVPVGTFFLVCHTDYSIWNFLVILLWLVILPMPQQKWLATAFTLLLAVLVWTQPLSIAALPPTLYWLWAEKRWFQRAMHALVLGAQGVHVFYGTHPEAATSARDSSKLVELGLAALERSASICIETLSDTLFPHAAALSPRLGQACAVGLLLALVACAVLPIKLRTSRSLALWILYCIVVPHLMILLIRRNGWHTSRYLYVMRVFAVVGMCAVLWEGLTYSVAKLQRFVRARALVWLPELIVLAYCASLNRPGANDGYAQSAPENGQIIKACFAELDRLQRVRGGPCHLYVQCRKGHGDWPFAIDSRKDCE